MNRNLYPTMDDDDTNNENVSSFNPKEETFIEDEQEEIPELEEEEILELEEEEKTEIPIFPNVATGQAQSTKRIIKIPASSIERRDFALIKNKKQRLNETIELAKNNLRAFITKYTDKTGKKPSDLSKEKNKEIFGKSIALQKYLEEELKKVEAKEEEFKRKYKERRTIGGRRRHRKTFKRLFLKKRITKKRKGTRKNKKRRNTKKY